MAQVTIYKDSGVDVVVIDGTPPADQSAQASALQAQVVMLTGERNALQAKLIALNAAIDAAQAAGG